MKSFISLASMLALIASPTLAQTRRAPARPAAKIADAPAAPRSAPKPLPVFSFMGQTTEAPATPFTLGKKPCSPPATGRSTCGAGFDGQIGEAKMLELVMIFYDGKIGSVEGFTVAGYFPIIADAFKAKYGEPALTETRKWQSKAGAVFDNSVMKWTFKGGVLELDSMGDERDQTKFTFVSLDNSPPPPKPVVNF